MRVLVPVFIVGIIAIAVLILVLSDRRGKRRRAEFSELEDRLYVYKQATAGLGREVNLQLQVGSTDLNQIKWHLDELNTDLDRLDKKDGR